jgi:hypothetical protein
MHQQFSKDISKGHAVRHIITLVVLTVLLALAGVAGVSSQGPTAEATTTNWDPSGQAMPVGDLPGWHQIFADNFANESYPLGSLTGCGTHGCKGDPNLDWGAVSDGHPDTSGHCEYDAPQTVSISGGVLNIDVHTDPSGVCLDASLYPMKNTAFLYGRYSVRFRSDAVAGYKGVYLLWPTNKINGEIDFPEANLDQPIQGFLHTLAGGVQKQFFRSGASWSGWHTATLEWTPSSVTYILDGVTIGSTTQDVPQTPMSLTLRAESDLMGAPKPPAGSQGNMQIDWATIYSYVPPSPVPTPKPPRPVSPPVPVTPTPGYDLVGSDGGVFAFGGGYYGSLPAMGVHVDDVTGIVATAKDNGYFLVGADGGVFAFHAPFANSLPGIGVHVDDVVGIVPTRTDQGYFLVGRDGGVFSFKAPFENSLPGVGIHVDDIVGIAATSDDAGYWLVGSNGAVYAFGDAPYEGSAPAGAVAITSTSDGKGYWVVGSNGAVTAFGDAGNYGDLPRLGVAVDNIVGIVGSGDSKGYNLIGNDGGVFSFGDAVNRASLPAVGVTVDNIVGAVPN